MLSVQDAARHISQYILPLKTELRSLERLSAACVLQEPLTADRDFPPFDRVTMDGIAFQYARFAEGKRTFRVEGSQFAGQAKTELTNPSGCLEVMTGAMLPAGTDTVVRYEDVEMTGEMARITIETVQAGQNIHRQAGDRRAGDRLVEPGTRLGPAEIAVAASVGKAELRVSAPPRLAVVSTGDELVAVRETPAPHQIRISNAYVLRTILQRAGAEVVTFHVADRAEEMKQVFGRLLADFDAVVLSGGVSAGKADLVPSVLESLGVRPVFHQVAQRPGKPLWFGATADRKPVFGLPGNPVSTFLCAYRYLLPWLKASLGETPAAAPVARLAEDLTFRPKLTYFLPVSLTLSDGAVWQASPLPGSGSGDYANLLRCDGFLELPPDREAFAAGEIFPLWMYR
ncbi:molybdopterin molybdotransferase MoeA [Tellurirhabdus rosea]|uniref:molybdopterin molybdotransferase MoeA n=1 Tax=Tellurirhabdus rosea TaxID=2674997 RepID=UPI0022555C7A|nr:molybdopterin molybdotransferase MoeA [Tellurirhabdus rosea]